MMSGAAMGKCTGLMGQFIKVTGLMGFKMGMVYSYQQTVSLSKGNLLTMFLRANFKQETYQ